MKDESGKDVSSKTVSRRRLLTALVGGAAATAVAIAGQPREAQAGHEGSNVFHLGNVTNTFGRGWLSVSEVGEAVIRGTNPSASDGSTGVWGSAVGGSGATSGVAGLSNSTSGIGVRGLAPAATGFTVGVHGQSNSTSGSGVQGIAFAQSGDTKGVLGQSNSTIGVGVFGIAANSSGNTRGVLGRAHSPDGVGVEALNTSATGVGLKVSGRSQFTTIVDGTIPDGVSSVTVTDSRVNANSQVIVMLMGPPGRGKGVSWVSVAAGSFTVNLIGRPSNSVPFRAFIAEKV